MEPAVGPWQIQTFHFLRTQRKPFESIVKHTSVAPDSSQPRAQEAQSSALLDQAHHRIATLAPALVAGDLKRVELTDQVAEEDHAVAGHRCGRLRWSEIDQEAN